MDVSTTNQKIYLNISSDHFHYTNICFDIRSYQMSHSCTDDDNFRNYHVEEKRQGRFEEIVMDPELAIAMSLFVLSKVILIICITGIFQNAPPAYSAFTPGMGAPPRGEPSPWGGGGFPPRPALWGGGGSPPRPAP